MTDVRRNNDLEKLRNLCAESNGKLSIISTSGTPVSKIELESKYKTVGDESYPNKISISTRFVIELMARYPFVEPAVNIKSNILHPNIYSSGRICLGRKWMPTETLDLFVKRILAIITYDKSIINEDSPANGDALRWYRTTVRNHPNMFPTDKLIFNADAHKQKMSWNNIK
jgi:ubiquitin-protein ligase